MRIYIEHDAAAVARLLGLERPTCDTVILRHGQPDEVLASTQRGNVLDGGWLLDVDSTGAHTVCWSGSLAEDLFASHPPNWLRPGREAFGAFCAEIAGQLRSHRRTLCFQPHSRHVLSDAASCLNLLREHDAGPFEVALSPATMLEPSMMSDLDDHLTRMFQSLGPRCAMVMLADVTIEHDELGEQRCTGCRLGQGRFGRDHVLALLREHVPVETPIVLMAGETAAQIDWLGDAAT